MCYNLLTIGTTKIHSFSVFMQIYLHCSGYFFKCKIQRKCGKHTEQFFCCLRESRFSVPCKFIVDYALCRRKNILQSRLLCYTTQHSIAPREFKELDQFCKILNKNFIFYFTKCSLLIRDTVLNSECDPEGGGGVLPEASKCNQGELGFYSYKWSRSAITPSLNSTACPHSHPWSCRNPSLMSKFNSVCRHLIPPSLQT